MITLLRKIRKRLLSENSFSSYLLYAIGEIALVVAGILIALQVNNWNTNRQLRQSEQLALQELKKEIEANNEQFYSQQILHRTVFDANDVLFDLLNGKAPPPISEDSLATLLGWPNKNYPIKTN